MFYMGAGWSYLLGQRFSVEVRECKFLNKSPETETTEAQNNGVDRHDPFKTNCV